MCVCVYAQAGVSCKSTGGVPTVSQADFSLFPFDLLTVSGLFVFQPRGRLLLVRRVLC